MPEDPRILEIAADPLPDGRVRRTFLFEYRDGRHEIVTDELGLAKYLQLEGERQFRIWVANGRFPRSYDHR